MERGLGFGGTVFEGVKAEEVGPEGMVLIWDRTRTHRAMEAVPAGIHPVLLPAYSPVSPEEGLIPGLGSQ